MRWDNAGTAPTRGSNINVCGERLPFWAIVPDIFGNYFYAAGNQVFISRIDGSCGAVAGSGVDGFGGDDGPAQLALLSSPHDLSVDSMTNDVLVADTLNNRVRRVSHATGFISTVAGTSRTNCSSSPDGIAATAACLSLPAGVALDLSGNLLVGEGGVNRVRIVYASSGLLGTIAGRGGAAGFCGDGGPATSACLWSGFVPGGALLTFALKLAVDPAGGVYIGDFGNNRVRRVSPTDGSITTYAGFSGVGGFSGDGGPATLAQLNNPSGLALKPGGALLIADFSNRRIRRVAPDGNISTWLGSGAPPQPTCWEGGLAPLATCLRYPYGISYFMSRGPDPRAGAYVASLYASNYNTSSITTGISIMLQVVGSNVTRIVDPIAADVCNGVIQEGALASEQCLLDASYPTVDTLGDIYFIAYYRRQVFRLRANDSRLVLTAGVGPFDTPLGDGGPAVDANIASPSNIALDNDRGLLYIGDAYNVRVRMVTLATGIISTVAGFGEVGFGGDGGPATAALFNPLITGGLVRLLVAVGRAGSFYVVDPGNGRIRVVIGGIISTVAGSNSSRSFCGDGGLATAACLFFPVSVACDLVSGDLYISDSYNLRLRRVSAATGIIDTVVGTGFRSRRVVSGPGLNPESFIYFADGCLDAFLRYDPVTSNVTALVGSGTRGWCNASDALETCLSSPLGVGFTAAGNVVFGDAGNGVIREIVSGGPPACPPGCLCPCAAPEKCSNAAAGFCTGGFSEAFPVSAGYYAVVEPGGCGGLSGQRPCPIGAVCAGGSKQPCPTGTFGVAELQTGVGGCESCAAGTYNAELGQTSRAACLPCPLGSTSAALASFCEWRPPNTARPASANPGRGCLPCASGTYALIGAPECAPLPAVAEAFAATAFGALVRYPPPFDYGADSSLGIQAIVGAALVVVGALPAIALLLVFLGVGPASVRAVVAQRLRGIDKFSEARSLGDGEPRVKRASALGGAVTAVAFGVMGAVGASLIAQYKTGNFIILSSVLPATTTALAGIATLDHRARAMAGSAAPPSLPPYFSSGMLLRIVVQGPACGALTDNTNGSFGLLGGAWVLSTSTANESQSHTLDLVCGDCTFGPLSEIDVSLDGRCQNVAITAAAVGAQGDVAVYAFGASGGAAEGGYLSEFVLSVPPTLDVLYDAAVLHASTRGLLLVGATADPMRSATPPAAVRVRAGLAVSGSLVQTRVDPIITLPQLISSLTGLAGMLGAFAAAFTFADGNRPAFRRAVAWLRAPRRCCRGGGGGAGGAGKGGGALDGPGGEGELVPLVRA